MMISLSDVQQTRRKTKSDTWNFNEENKTKTLRMKGSK